MYNSLVPTLVAPAASVKVLCCTRHTYNRILFVCNLRSPCHKPTHIRAVVDKAELECSHAMPYHVFLWIPAPAPALVLVESSYISRVMESSQPDPTHYRTPRLTYSGGSCESWQCHLHALLAEAERRHGGIERTRRGAGCWLATTESACAGAGEFLVGAPLTDRNSQFSILYPQFSNRHGTALSGASISGNRPLSRRSAYVRIRICIRSRLSFVSAALCNA
jgi:hypothetical protein